MAQYNLVEFLVIIGLRRLILAQSTLYRTSLSSSRSISLNLTDIPTTSHSRYILFSPAIPQTLNLYSQVQDIFRIERNGEDERFKQSPYAKVKGSDRRLLWHGSRVTNFGGILSQGLRIAPPEAPVNGYAFGKVRTSKACSPSTHYRSLTPYYSRAST